MTHNVWKLRIKAVAWQPNIAAKPKKTCYGELIAFSKNFIKALTLIFTVFFKWLNLKFRLLKRKN